MKINLFGIYPPPYGGISIHIKRLQEKLSEKNIAVEIFSTGKKNLSQENLSCKNFRQCLIKMLKISPEEIIHSHFTGIKGKIFIGYYSLFLKKKTIITIHGAGLTEQYDSLNFILKKMYRYSLQNISHIIVVNPAIKDECLKLGVQERKISVISPYINPIISKQDYEKIDKKVWDFIEERKKEKDIIITANGNIRFYNNEDLYGIDLLIELVKRLKEKKYKISLIFALLGYEQQSNKERIYFENLLNRIKEYGLEQFIYFYRVKDTEYYPILEKCDIFIRPTNIDGDAISLREGLYLKKICIASDIVIRPNEVILFKNRDVKDLLLQVKNVIKSYKFEKEKLNNLEIKEYFNEILEVYNELLKEN